MQDRYLIYRDRRAAQLAQAQTIRVRLWQTRCSRARRAARRSRRRRMDEPQNEVTPITH
jgi:hypothetical protein